MPRKARITLPGAVHHVMSRGVEGNPIFTNDEDRSYFLKLLETNISKSGYLLYAWCLMDNHYHLILRVNEYPLGKFMRLLNGPYAQYFRKTFDKRGYLFQDRYKSIVTQDQLYIEELVRYVHLNPVRAGICADVAGLKKYRWCGHAALMGRNQLKMQNVKDVLLRFDTDKIAARKKYCAFLKEGLQSEPDIFKTLRASNNEKEKACSTGSWVIGNRDFIVNALERHKEIAQGAATPGVTVEMVITVICRTMNVKAETIKWKSRNSASSKARRIIAYTANRKYQIPTKEIARHLGVTSSAVSNMVRDGEVLAKGMVLKELCY